jgi:hypothetical protein
MAAFLILFMDYSNVDTPAVRLAAGDTAQEAIEIALEEAKKAGDDLVFLPDYDSTAEEVTEANLISPTTLVEWNEAGPDQLVYWPDNSEIPYRKAEFIRLCHGNEGLAYKLYRECEWQHPETILDEDSREEVAYQDFPTCHIQSS